MSHPDIKRQVELYLVARLTSAVPSHQFVPFTGGLDGGISEEIEPPFTVVAVTRATKEMMTEGTWTCQGTVQIVTNSSETSSQAQSDLTRLVYAALAVVPLFGDGTFFFHGIDVNEITHADDDKIQAHADIISFACGAGG